MFLINFVKNLADTILVCIFALLKIKKEKEGTGSPLFAFAKRTMIPVEKIKEIIDVKIAESTNFIVDLSVKPGNKIVVLLDNDKGVSIADCVAMSRHIEFSLDREVEDFELNVMSPGLTEPLKILRQYQKYLGKEVDVVTKENKKLSGKLLSANELGIQLETRSKEKAEGKKGKQIIINNINLTFSQIKETKIVISF